MSTDTDFMGRISAPGSHVRPQPEPVSAPGRWSAPVHQPDNRDRRNLLQRDPGGT
ncbi:MAG: hypothetical protein WCC12_24050 [Anaerolineales bacterium]